MTSSPSFGPSCPAGGSWYACGNGTKFTGCCTRYPCTDNGCFQGNLRPASFLASAYGTFPDQQCEAGSWYTCQDNTPPFLGCCASNPCSPKGCPTSDLRAGFLSDNAEVASKFDPEPPLEGSGGSTSSTTSGSTSAATSKTSSVPAVSATNSITTSNMTVSHLQSNSVPVAAIAGGVAGGAAAFILIGLAVWYVLHLRRSAALHHSHHHQSYQPVVAQSPDKTWPTPSTSYYDPPNQTDAKTTPAYTTISHPYQQNQQHDPAIPTMQRQQQQQQIHEAGSREVSFVAYSQHHSQQYSPASSPVWGSDRNSGARSHTEASLGVRSVIGNNESTRAELDTQR